MGSQFWAFRLEWGIEDGNFGTEMGVGTSRSQHSTLTKIPRSPITTPTPSPDWHTPLSVAVTCAWNPVATSFASVDDDIPRVTHLEGHRETNFPGLTELQYVRQGYRLVSHSAK